MYARKFGWTPQQVDDIPLDVEQWLLPLIAVIDEVAEKRQAEANAH